MQRSREIEVLTGNYAAAYAVMHSRVEVIAAYPITPQTTIVEKIDELIASGKFDATMIRIESEHSAMAATIGASAAGARAFTATSSHGLFYMYENLWWTANSRLPVVSAFVTRALGPPWNIWSDHQDVYSLRDSGWILLFARNAQEVYDLIIQSFKIAEDDEVRLPVGVAYDAFIVSHTAEPVELLHQDEVDSFLPSPEHIAPLLDPGNPLSIGNLPTAEEHYMLRKNIWECIEYSRVIFKKVGKEFGELSGRDYSDPLPAYRIDDAEYIIVSIGAMSGDAEDAVDKLRDKGVRAGSIAVRLLRPFPRDEFIQKIADAKYIAVFNRGVSMGMGGVITSDIRYAIEGEGLSKNIYDIIAGLGGVEVSYEDYAKVIYDIINGKLDRSRTYFIVGGEYV